MSFERWHPYLSDDARRWHATMVLGGWRFECVPNDGVQPGRYYAVNPQGEAVAVRYSMLLCVQEAWHERGGNGQ